jgi:hypothetical protein
MPLAACNRLFTVAKVPLAAQLGANLCIGIGAHDLAANDHFVLIDRVLIGRLLRKGGARKQRKAESRQNQLGTERFHRCILYVRHRASLEDFRRFGSARLRKMAERSSQFSFGIRPIDLNFADEFIRYCAQ